MILTHESGAQEDQFDEKKRRPKISWYYPFKWENYASRIQSWIRIRIWWWNFRIRQKGPDPTGSGSATLCRMASSIILSTNWQLMFSQVWNNNRLCYILDFSKQLSFRSKLCKNWRTGTGHAEGLRAAVVPALRDLWYRPHDMSRYRYWTGIEWLLYFRVRDRSMYQVTPLAKSRARCRNTRLMEKKNWFCAIISRPPSSGKLHMYSRKN